MGKGAFRGSLHFCGQARQSARTRSKRPFPASRRRGSSDRPPHFPAGRQAGRPKASRHSSAPPLSGRPTPVSASDCPPRLPDKQTPALSGRHAPGSRLTGTLRAIPVCQQPVPAAGVPLPAPTEQTCCRASLICQRHDHGHDRGRGSYPPAGANRDCGIGCRTCKKSAAPDPARRPGLPEKGRKPRIHICIHLPFKFLSPSLVSDRGRKPLSLKFMFSLIVDCVS